MGKTFRAGCLLTLVCAAGGLAQEKSAPTDAVALKAVTYDQLKAAVRAQRGKVVVVDIWGEF